MAAVEVAAGPATKGLAGVDLAAVLGVPDAGPATKGFGDFASDLACLPAIASI